MAGDNKPKQQITDFDALYQQAKKSQPLYTEQMNGYLAQLRHRYPGVFDNVHFEQGPLKSRERALAKINGDYDGQTDKIADLVRGRFVVSTAQQADIIRHDLQEHPPFKIEELKDQFAEPLETLFRAENAKIRLSNGHMAELRVEHEGMLEAAMGTHKLYEDMQQVERRALQEHRDPTPEETALHNQIRDKIGVILDRAAVEGHLDPLLNDKGRAQVEAFRERMGISNESIPLARQPVPQAEANPPQNLPALAVPNGEHNEPLSPVRIPKPAVPAPSEQVPERIPLSTKIGVNGTIVSVVVGTGYEAGLAYANDGSARDVGKAALHGLANSALPGVKDRFRNITENNSHQNWVDQTLNAGTTATQGVAVGALVVAGGSAAAAPVTGGTSLAVTGGSLFVAGVSGVANLGIGLVHDVTYATGVSKQGGVITGLAHMVGELADSKKVHRVEDWVMGNNAKVEHELAAKGISQKQLAGVDQNRDGAVTAQEARNYLIKHHVAADKVNSLPAQALADTLVAIVKVEAPAAHANLSPDMLSALCAAKGISLSNSIQHDAGHESAPHRTNVAHAPTPAQNAAYGR